MSTGVADCGRVTILLSTYNGSKYLRNQLDSLYAQTYPNIRILVRDDGSSDSTCVLLEKERSAGCIELLEGHGNLGPALSFFELLKKAALTDTEFVAFCDQDDIWLPAKISKAVSSLIIAKEGVPAMYCSRQELVDEHLAHIGYSPLPRKIGFGNALVENVALGCSMVLNRPAIDLIVGNLPAKVVIHDWWCYLVISCFGEVIFDAKANIKYRQHSANTIGVGSSALVRLLRKYSRFFGGGGGHLWMSEQALSMMSEFGGTIPSSQRQVMTKFIEAKSSLTARIKLATSKDVWRQNRVDDLLLRFLIVINRF